MPPNSDLLLWHGVETGHRRNLIKHGSSLIEIDRSLWPMAAKAHLQPARSAILSQPRCSSQTLKIKPCSGICFSPQHSRSQHTVQAAAGQPQRASRCHVCHICGMVAALTQHHALPIRNKALSALQAEASETRGPVAELEFDTEEAAPSGYDAFADLVQMAVREDPSLANVASSSGQLTSIYTCSQILRLKDSVHTAVYTCICHQILQCL